MAEKNDAVARGVISPLEGEIVDIIMAHTKCPQEVAIAAMDEIAELPSISERLKLVPIAPMDVRKG